MSSHARKKGSKYCPLCLDEKVTILRTQDEESLNDRSELMTRCRHADSYMLANCFNPARSRRSNAAPRDASLESTPAIIQQSEEVQDEPVVQTSDAQDIQVEYQVAQVYDEPAMTLTDARDHEPEDQLAGYSGRPRRNGRVDYGRFF